MPNVSVIIPNYNHYKFLEKRFDSILNQTYQDFEIIYLDDASTDNSDAIFKKYKDDSRIKAFLNDKNSGSPFKQWNKGVKEAKGEYIWIAESDDFSERIFLETMVNVLERNPTIGLVYCQSSVIDEENNYLYNNEKWTQDIDPSRWRKNYVNKGWDEIANYLAIKNTIPNASAVLFRRSIFMEVGGSPENYRYSGDWVTWIRILTKSDIGFVAKPLNLFRIEHKNSARRFANKAGLSIMEALSVVQFITELLTLNSQILMRSISYRYNLWKNISIKHHIPMVIQNKIIGLFSKISIGYRYKMYAWLPLILFIRGKRLFTRRLHNMISEK